MTHAIFIFFDDWMRRFGTFSRATTAAAAPAPSLVFTLRPVHRTAPPAPRKIARPPSVFAQSSTLLARTLNTMSTAAAAAAAKAAKAAYESAVGQPSIAGAMITASTETAAHVSR